MKPPTQSPAGAARAAYRAERGNWRAYQKFPQMPDLYIAQRIGVSNEIECSSLAQAEDVIDLACWRAALDAVKGLTTVVTIVTEPPVTDEMKEDAHNCGIQAKRDRKSQIAPVGYTNIERHAWMRGYGEEAARMKQERRLHDVQRKAEKLQRKAEKPKKAVEVLPP
jgi:hypothetical protein